MSQLRRFLKILLRDFRRNLIESVSFLGRKSIRWGAARAFHRGAQEPDAVVIMDHQETTLPVAPDSLRVRSWLGQHLQQPWPIFWQKIPNARLVGKSLAVLSPAKTLMIESVFGNGQCETDPSSTYLHLPRATKLTGNWTSLLSRWCPPDHSNYYHWLLDGLPRLALLDRFPADTGILVGRSLPAYQQETLEILGVLDRCRPTRERHLEIENYYFSSPPAITGCDNPYAIRFLRDRFLNAGAALPQRFEKIYVSRQGGARSPQNEAGMLEILKAQGWAIIQAEKLSFREQISLFAGARAVCAVHGAGLTNLLWCSPGTRVLELCASNFLNGCYESLAAYNDLDYRYQVYEADRHYRMQIDLNSFEQVLSQI